MKNYLCHFKEKNINKLNYNSKVMSIYLTFRELATRSCKVFLVLAAVIGFVISANAQDVIVTKEGKKINAKVTEVNENDIRYKDFENINGPSYFMKKSEISTILYQNGKVDVFNNQPTTTTTPQVNVNQNNMPQDNLKNEFDRIGTDDDAMLEFFRRNNFTKYYNDFSSACRMRSTGAALLGVGIGLSAGGFVFLMTGLFVSDELFLAGLVLLPVGHVFTIVSIPVSAAAGGRKRSIKNDFAKEKFGVGGYTYQPTLNLGFTGNGLGLTLKF